MIIEVGNRDEGVDMGEIIELRFVEFFRLWVYWGNVRLVVGI